VGSDEFGVELKTRLELDGVDTSGVQTIEGENSGTCVVIVESDIGESRNLAYQGANLRWAPRDQDTIECLAGGKKPDLVITHLGIRREQVERVLGTATQYGIDTVLNPSPAVYLTSSTFRNVTHLLMNETEAAMLSGRTNAEYTSLPDWEAAAKIYIEYGVKYVVLTLGAKGAYYTTYKGEKGLVPAEKDVKVIDTTGAGLVIFFLTFSTLQALQYRTCSNLRLQNSTTNTFNDYRDTFVGTYAVEYVRQKLQGRWDISEAIARACRASARTIERLGAQESIPWSDEIDP